MEEKNFFIMLVDTPWGGPTIEAISVPDLRANRGRVIGPLKEKYKLKLILTPDTDPEEFPARDITEKAKFQIFSKKFIGILDQLQVNNIEYFDADVTYEPTGEQLDYKVANIIGVISGLDLEKSQVIYDEDDEDDDEDDPFILEIEKMCFDDTKMKGNKIFRLQESIMHIVVHKSIKKAVEAAGLTGFMFVSDDEFEMSML